MAKKRKGGFLTIVVPVLETCDDLIGAAYGAVTQPERWQEVLARYAANQGCSGVALVTPALCERDGGFALGHGLREEVLHLWREHSFGGDCWYARGMHTGRLSEGQFIGGERGGDDKAITQSPFFRELVLRAGTGPSCVGVVVGTGNPQLPVVFLTSFHKSSVSPKPKEAWQEAKPLLAHFRRVLELQVSLAQAQQAAALSVPAVDRLLSPILLLNVHGKVIACNHAAAQILDRQDGLRLRAGQVEEKGTGWLEATHPLDEQPLQTALRGALEPASANPTSATVRLRRAATGTPLLAQFLPVDGNRHFIWRTHQPAAIVLVSDPDRRASVDAGVLIEQFRLSRAEARLAQALIEGGTLKDLARRLDLSPNTIKTQLAAIHTKTGTTRQSQLLRLLLSLSRTV